MSNPNRIFIFNDEPYMRIIPAKRLFNSTMVHEVCTRGDFFAVNIATNVFTILPNGADENDKQLQSNNKSVRGKKLPDLNKDLFSAAD